MERYIFKNQLYIKRDTKSKSFKYIIIRQKLGYHVLLFKRNLSYNTN